MPDDACQAPVGVNTSGESTEPGSSAGGTDGISAFSAAALRVASAIEAAEDPKAEEARFIADYKEKFFNPYQAADVGQIDEVIEPRETRARLVRSLEVLRTKVTHSIPKKHGLFPV